MISTLKLAQLVYLKLLAEDIANSNPDRFELPQDSPHFRHKTLLQQRIDDQEKLVEQDLKDTFERDDELDDTTNT